MAVFFFDGPVLVVIPFSLDFRMGVGAVASCDCERYEETPEPVVKPRMMLCELESERLVLALQLGDMELPVAATTVDVADCVLTGRGDDAPCAAAFSWEVFME